MDERKGEKRGIENEAKEDKMGQETERRQRWREKGQPVNKTV